MIGRHNTDKHTDTPVEDRHDNRHDNRHDDRRDDTVTQGHHDDRYSDPDRAGYAEHRRREAFGGINWGAGFFGWLVAIATAVLLSSIIGAIAAGVGSEANVTQSQAEQDAGTIGIVAAIVLLAVLLIAYYTGGYVAGRMSRFDGGKQGLAVWVIGLVITLIAVGLGVLFGTQYNILDRVDLPTMPVPTDALSLGGAITALAVLVGTLLAAMAGGKVGRRYHRKVDDAGYV